MAGDPRRKGAKGGGSKGGKPPAETVSIETLTLLASHGITALTLAQEPLFLAQVLAAQKLARTPGQSAAALIDGVVKARAQTMAERKHAADAKAAALFQRQVFWWITCVVLTVLILGSAYLMLGDSEMFRRVWQQIYHRR